MKKILLLTFLFFGQPLLGSEKNFSPQFFRNFFAKAYPAIGKEEDKEIISRGKRFLVRGKAHDVGAMLSKLKQNKKYTFKKPLGTAYVCKVRNDLTLVQIPIPLQNNASECVFATEYYSGADLFGGTDFNHALGEVKKRQKKSKFGNKLISKNSALIESSIKQYSVQQEITVKQVMEKARKEGFNPIPVFGDGVKELRSGVIRILIPVQYSRKYLVSELLLPYEEKFKIDIRGTQEPRIIILGVNKPLPHCFFVRLELVGNQKVLFIFDSWYNNVLGVEGRIEYFKTIVDAFTSKL